MLLTTGSRTQRANADLCAGFDALDSEELAIAASPQAFSWIDPETTGAAAGVAGATALVWHQFAGAGGQTFSRQQGAGQHSGAAECQREPAVVFLLCLCRRGHSGQPLFSCW